MAAISRKGMALGIVGAGVAGALALGVGIAQAATGTNPVSAVAQLANGNGNGTGSGNGAGNGNGLGVSASASTSTGANAISDSDRGTCITAAASYLGMTETDLRDRLRDGETMAEIATAEGLSVSGLEEALLAAITAKIDANTTLSDEQRAICLDQAASRVSTIVNEVHSPRMGRS